MIGARVVYNDPDFGPIGGEIIEICGRYDDIKGVRWDDGILKGGRCDPAHAYDDWPTHRPHFTAADDWLAAGIAAHRARHTGPTCVRNGRCDFHPDDDHAELMRILAEDNVPAVTETTAGAVQDSLFDDLTAQEPR